MIRNMEECPKNMDFHIFGHPVDDYSICFNAV